MTYDLRSANWIPWRRRSGSLEWGSVALLTDSIQDDPVVAIAAPRPDFGGALQEFLIGVLTLSLLPDDESEWRELWHHPPSPDELRVVLDGLPDGFALDGNGPRAFQDLAAEEFEALEPLPIDRLLIDAAGEQSRTLNKDLFIKRDRIVRLGMPAAAMALITMQTYAPAGGQGHRTSIRGGGPLTTLVDPRVDARGEVLAHQQPLWQKLWANVETRSQWERRSPNPGAFSLDRALPWLQRTRTSQRAGGRPTTPADTHPLECYFGLPRRIRLDFAESGTCDMTGEACDMTVTHFRMRNYGVQYASWEHPLSPYYRTKASADYLPIHGQPDGIGWRDWLGLTVRTPDNALRKPAAVVAAFHERGPSIGVSVLRLETFGYDMDNMKARDWIASELPAFAIKSAGVQRIIADTANRLVDATGITAAALYTAVKQALFQADEVAGDLSRVKSDLWSVTESAFYEAIRTVVMSDDPRSVADDACSAFHSGLADSVLMVFDRWCPAGSIKPEALRRLVHARFTLVMTLRGCNKLGKRLYNAVRLTNPCTSTGSRSRTEEAVA